MAGDVVANDQTIDADHRVEQQEQEEPFVVVQAHASVHPDAVMVEFFTARVAQGAMLGTSRLGQVTSVTPCTFGKHDVVIWIAFKSAFDSGLISTLAKVAWVGRTCLIVAIVARCHARPGDVNVIL